MFHFQKIANSGGKWIQDGRAGECGARLPLQTHQKYIYMGKHSQWKVTGKWQKDSVCNKDPHILGEGGKKSGQVGTCAKSGDAE